MRGTFLNTLHVLVQGGAKETLPFCGSDVSRLLAGFQWLKLINLWITKSREICLNHGRGGGVSFEPTCLKGRGEI